MIKKISRFAIVAALGAGTLAFHVDSASAQAPRPRNDRTFEFGEGRNVPCDVSRKGTPNERYQYYRKGWWYDSPWWLGACSSPYEGSSAAFRVYGSSAYAYDGTGPIADPYPTRSYRYNRNGSWYDSPAGFLTAPLTLPFRVATAPFRALSGEPVYGRGRHADWCSARYRSYRPSTNTWVSYRGVARRCISPYS
jgi:hypothetical protein